MHLPVRANPDRSISGSVDTRLSSPDWGVSGPMNGEERFFLDVRRSVRGIAWGDRLTRPPGK